jgi:cytochrome P450
MPDTPLASSERPTLVDRSFHAGDPYPWYRQWRREEPVFWDEKGGFWVVTRHADIVAISRDPERFCSKKGVLPADLERGVAEDSSIIFMDPPRHRSFRKLVQPGLTNREIAYLEPWIRDLARSLIAKVDGSDPVEFVESFAIPLPIWVIARLLGVPTEDHEDFRRWSDAAIDAATEITPRNAAETAEMLTYLAAHIERKRATPGDDLISVLVRAEVDGERLNDQELVMFALTLLVAGNETTRNLLSAGTKLLATHPDERRALAANPAGIPRAVEEMLRLESPIVAFMRTATCDVEILGQAVREGDPVLMVYAAANRDEAVFGEDAEHFVPTRHPNPHLAFGIGEHFCLGANLARLEGRICFEELLARHPEFELAGEPRWMASTLVRGLTDLPISFGR